MHVSRTAAAVVLTFLLAACARVPQEKAGETPPGPTSGRSDVVATSPAILPAESAATDRPVPVPSPVSPPAPAREAESGRHHDLHATPGTLAAVRQFQAGHADAARREKAVSLGEPGPAELAYAEGDEFRERYQSLNDNPVHRVAETPVSTFSIDVDTGSYSNVRRMLSAGQLPPPDAVRVEELVNYFPYDYAAPADASPFAVHTELAPSPWNAGNVILRVAIKGRDQAKETLPPANLVFLVDVSGSMHSPDKLPLLQSSLKLLVNELRDRDRITLVTYAGQTAVVLPPTPGSERARIATAIDALTAGGSTAGASGIDLAYKAARQAFISGGINRILLATDGDFNVGVTDFRQLKAMVEEKRKSGVALTTLGFGTGNYNEQLMEQLADAGDGAYSYVDNLMEGHKVLVNEMTSTLATIARDVKVQIEFNPAAVSEYRLIGYENRALQREDFNNDRVDAGDIGAGHTVTALYELTLADGQGLIDEKRYGSRGPVPPSGHADELAHVKLRYKEPEASTSKKLEYTVSRASVRAAAQASGEFRFAMAVAGFGQLLRGGRYTGGWSFADARSLAGTGVGEDRFGYRGEFLRMVDLARSLSTRKVGDATAGTSAPR